ncbi:MAG TPA: alpha/beta fold hydrolase [Rhizomicrobium sp.]
MRMAFAALSLALFGISIAYADDLSGTWTGYWVKDHDPLPVTVTLDASGSGFTGHFDSDAIQVAGIPCSVVREDGDKIHLEVKGDQTTTTFDGVLAGGAIKGTFTEGTKRGAFILNRAATPPPAVATRDVTFTDGDAKLAGTLLLPSTPGKHPAILFLQGSGPEGRWANHWLAQKFAQAGFVALIYDKRGVGQSTGDWKIAGFDTLAADAVAGIRMLQSQPEVDPKRVGIYGHSQGGTIAPMVAAKAGDLGFVIASAAGGIAPADVELYSVENSAGVSKLPTDQQIAAKAYIEALIGVAYRGEDRATLDALAEADKSQPWYFDPPPPGNFYWALSRQIAGFNPSRWWRQVHAPVLLVYGAHDERVPPKTDLTAIRSALKAGHNEHFMSIVFPGSNHIFTVVDPAKTTGWPKREPSYAATLIDWARQQVRPQPPNL